jgi:hypothetical protein
MRLRQLFSEAPDLQTSSGWAAGLLGGVNTALNQPWLLDQPETNPGATGATGTGTGNLPQGAGGTGNARTAMSFFQRRGLTAAQSAGVVGNLQAESGANLNIGAVGDGGKARGIAQWHPDRLARFARATGKAFERSTLMDQLNFIWWELNNTERAAMSKLRAARTAEQAAAVFDQYYERSSGAHRGRRIANAQALMAPASGTATA